MEGVTNAAEHKIRTPFRRTVGRDHRGKIIGPARLFFAAARPGHRILPHELNHRANIYALRSLNVRWIICVTAVGSLQEKYAPRDVLLPSQFYDRTSQRAGPHIFRRRHRGAHRVSPSRSAGLRNLFAEAARELKIASTTAARM